MLGFIFHFHDLRHYYASVILALGILGKYEMQQMGHSSTSMLKNVCCISWRIKRVKRKSRSSTTFKVI